MTKLAIGALGAASALFGGERRGSTSAGVPNRRLSASQRSEDVVAARRSRAVTEANKKMPEGMHVTKL